MANFPHHGFFVRNKNWWYLCLAQYLAGCSHGMASRTAGCLITAAARSWISFLLIISFFGENRTIMAFIKRRVLRGRFPSLVYGFVHVRSSCGCSLELLDIP